MIMLVTAASNRDLQTRAEPMLFERKDRLTRSDLWAWLDAVLTASHDPSRRRTAMAPSIPPSPALWLR